MVTRMRFVVITKSRHYDIMTVFYPSQLRDIAFVHHDYPATRIPIYCKFMAHILLLCVDEELAKLAQLS